MYRRISLYCCLILSMVLLSACGNEPESNYTDNYNADYTDSDYEADSDSDYESNSSNNQSKNNSSYSDSTYTNDSTYSAGDSTSETCSHGSCTKKRLSGSRYCSSHTCHVSGCYKEVPGANERCATHKQEYYNELGIGDKSDVPNCVISGCNTDAYKDSVYCISHKCRQNGCNAGQYNGNKYCYDHCPH